MAKATYDEGSTDRILAYLIKTAPNTPRVAPTAGDGLLSPYKSTFVTGFPLSAAAKADLLEFLRSLTDAGFTTDPRFSDPFAAPAPGRP